MPRGVWRVVVVMVVVVMVVVMVVEGSKIYTPSNIHELRQDIALRKCKKDPLCVLPEGETRGVAASRCKITPENMDKIITEIVEEKKMNRLSTKTQAEEGTEGGTEGGTEEGAEEGAEEGSGAGCNKMAGEVVWPATGECVALLTRGPCPPGYWVKLQASTLKPVCDPQPCEYTETNPDNTTPGQTQTTRPGLMINGTCQAPEALPPSLTCPQGQEVVANAQGELECDCGEGLIYYARDRRCYEPFTRGPCASGFVLQAGDSTTHREARCVPNVCPEERMVAMDSNCRTHTHTDTHTDTHNTQNTRDTNCYAIGTAGPCTDGEIVIHPNTLEPICVQPHTIFDRPRTPCPGGLREGDGTCTPTVGDKLRDIPPIALRLAGRESRTCPDGYLYAGGFCIRIVER